MPSPRTWREAWAEALYGRVGFSVRGGRGPRHDFSTSVTRGPGLAQALAVALLRLQLAGTFDVVDVGSGDGQLLLDLMAALPAELVERGRFTAVELAPRPPGLPAGIAWLPEPPATIHGLLIAHEYLDTVPCDVAIRSDSGWRVLMEDDSPGPEVDADQAAWLDRWWPPTGAGHRADVGRTREAAWRALTGRLTSGLAIAVDYAHVLADRPPGSTLAGWSRGRPVTPTADGEVDLTAHVALDACADPGDLVLTQRDALTRLGMSDSGASDPDASAEPPDARTRLARLADASRRRALLDPDGLGGYLWLIHATGGLDAASVFRRENDP